MQNLQEDLKELLKNDESYLVDGELNKNKIVESALKIEPKLIKLLISNDTFKKHFFEEVEGVLVFDKIKFQRFVSNKSFLPDSYTAFKNKIGLVLNDDYQDNFIKSSNDVVLAFPHKDCILEGGQTKEDQKRNEIFWNETLAPDSVDRLLDPKAFTNFKKYDTEGEHKVSEITEHDNLIIKGNNLLVSSSLLTIYRGKAKLIYMDPPYNTGGANETFTYNNSFNHSTWLTFMKNRLNVAKNLLRDDGFAVLTIDHYELFYIGILMDEIFGRNNRVGIVSVVHKPEGRNQEKFFGTSNEFMLVYAKNKDLASFQKVVLDEDKQLEFSFSDNLGNYKYKNFIRLTDGKYALQESKPEFYYPIYVSKDLKDISLIKNPDYYEIFPITDKGIKRTWKTKPDTFLKYYNEGNIEVLQENGQITIYEKLRESQVIKTHWVKKKYHAYHFGTKILEEIIGRKAFSFPKSLYAVQDVIKLMTAEDDLIIDFFGGSGTTAHAVLDLNQKENTTRRFILAEQLNEHIEVSIERINILLNSQYKKDSFIYAELNQYNQYFVDRIQDAGTKEEILSIWQEMQEKAFLSYQFDKDIFNERLDAFKTADLDTMKKVLVEVLDKNQLYVNFSEIEDETYSVSEEDKALNYSFYNRK